MTVDLVVSVILRSRNEERYIGFAYNPYMIFWL